MIKPDNAIAPNLEQADTTVAEAGLGRGQVLSAFFGLDNKLPLLAGWRICPGASQADGMPVIFDLELRVDTLQAGDFRVRTKSGKQGSVTCVTFMPAVDPGELRTVLLVGEFGSAKADPPATLEIAGHVLSKDGRVDYQGARIDVTPLEAGPTIVVAEVAPLSETLPKKGSWATGSGCPAWTKQAIRVVWTGGIRKRDGDELGEFERRVYVVEMADGRKLTPLALGDLDDGDNNNLLCMEETGVPKRVSFPAGQLVDPNRDVNPATSVAVTSR